MTGVNSILSGLFIDAGVSGSAGRQTSPLPSPVQPGQQNDIFIPGQWWKNQAVAKPDSATSGRSCSCNNCTQCAARAYATQAQKSSQPPAPPESGNPAPPADAPPADADPAQESSTASQVDQGQSPEEPEAANPGETAKPDGNPLSQAEKQQLALLQKIDTQVRAHEMAHIAVAGSLAKGGPSFQYQKGPDGVQYAVAGEVQIDMSKESTPDATVSKMATVRAAALAPADPSPQDRRVAANATTIMSDARHKLQQEELREIDESNREAKGAAKIEVAAGQESTGITELPGSTGRQDAVSGGQPSDSVTTKLRPRAGYYTSATQKQYSGLNLMV